SAESLQSTATQMNRVLPVMIDQDTEWSSTSALPGTFVYHYRLVNLTVPAGRVAAVGEQLQGVRQQIVRGACADPQVKQTFLNRGVVLRYSYTDREHVFIAAIEVRPSDCTSFGPRR